jgi:maltokinase
MADTAMIDVPLDLLSAHLAQQRWFAGDEPPARLEVAARRVLRADQPWLESVEVLADGARYHLLLGARRDDDDLSFLHNEQARVGSIEVEGTRAVVYDAVVDSELSIEIARRVVPDEQVERARPLAVEQSNTSLVFDERLLLKLFRRLSDKPNADVVVPQKLAEAGCPSVVPLLGVWREDGRDLVTVQPFLAEATDGWHLALTSLRDFLAACEETGEVCDPAAAGGDFAGEAERLGVAVAELHDALARVFGRTPGDPAAWHAAMRAQVERAGLSGAERDAVEARLQRLLDLGADVGPAMRVHGDLHLGQALRSDAGWVIVDFEGEPDRPEEEREAPSSPLRDVAGILRSLHYASAVATRERLDDDAASTSLAGAWEERNRKAFLDGYMPLATKSGLLPRGQVAIAAVLEAFEFDKAVYELCYERAHRPGWVDIPEAAIRRIVKGGLSQ